MSGTTPTIGALPAATPQTSTQAYAPQSNVNFGQNYESAPESGNSVQAANRGFAVGNLYDDYRKAQLEKVTGDAALTSAARQRVTQIWEAGANNPNVQQDKKVHGQLAQLFKTMGSPIPVGADGRLNWDSLAPVKNLTELPPTTLQWLTEQNPSARKAFLKGNHIIGADDTFMNAPALMTGPQKVAFQNEYAKNVQNGGYRGMTPGAFKSWVETNRSHFDEVFPTQDGTSAADHILQDPAIFSEMKQQTEEGIKKVDAQIQRIKGLDPKSQAQIKELQARVDYDKAHINEVNSISKFDTIKGNYVQQQIDQNLVGAQIKALNDAGQKNAADGQKLMEDIHQLQVSGGASPLGQVTKQYTQAVSVMRAALQSYTSEQNSGLGINPVTEATLNNALDQVSDLKTAMDRLSNPQVQKQIQRATAERRTNVPTQSTGAGDLMTGWKPEFKDAKGNQYGHDASGNIVDAKGKKYSQ